MIKKFVIVVGMIFDNLVGFVVGFDKNGDCIDVFVSMGFGFVEIGMVMFCLQLGNLKFCLFRILEKYVIINCMGFNNKGVDYFVE